MQCRRQDEMRPFLVQKFRFAKTVIHKNNQKVTYMREKHLNLNRFTDKHYY